MNTIASTAYAAARIDGTLDCRSLKVGVLKASSQMTPVISFSVLAGLQRHPIWALDRLAAVVYCYCRVAKERSPRELDFSTEVTLSASLVSGSEMTCIVASSINWHTSKEIRSKAEAMIAAMTCDGSRWSTDRWPFKDHLRMPVGKP